jgi:extracellular elastinolytic metalloproteinase
MRGLLLGSLAALSITSTAHPASRKQLGVSKRAVDLDAFRLKVSAEYVNATAVTADPPVVLNKRASAQDIATELVQKTVPGAKFRIVESYTGNNGVTHVYFRQTANDIDIDNADFNVNVSVHLNSFRTSLTIDRLAAMERSSPSVTPSTRERFLNSPALERETASMLPAR